MNHVQRGFVDSASAPERSEIMSEHIQATHEKGPKTEVAGFPWQFAFVLVVISLGMLIVLLKGLGVF